MGDSLESISTLKRSWINNLVLYPSEQHQAEGKWFSLLCSLNFLIKETSLILFLKLMELDFSEENWHWFLKRWQSYTFFSLLGFICLQQLQFWFISSYAPAISWLSPALNKVYGAKWGTVISWMKNKMCWATLSMSAPCVQHAKIISS